MRAQIVHARAARLISILVALGIAFCLCVTQAARAQVISQATRSQMVEVTTRPSGDIIQWGQFNLAPGTTFPTPQPFTSYGGVEGSIEVDQRGNATIEEQCCVGVSGLFDGNFAPGDLLIQTNNGAVRLTLSFKPPLKSVGTQIAENQMAAFTAQIQAFNHNKLLGTFSENGIVN